MNVAEQVEVGEVPGTNVHGDPLNDPDAVPVFEKDTVPVGFVGDDGAVSVTVALQVTT